MNKIINYESLFYEVKTLFFKQDAVKESTSYFAKAFGCIAKEI